MNAAAILSPSTASPKPDVVRTSVCPFHDGSSTLDLLLAEIDPADSALFDAALDLRSLANGRDAAGCLRQLFRVRALLGGRHYLAFFRVRCWARRTFRIEVRTGAGEVACCRELPLDGGRLEEIVNCSLACLARGDEVPAGAHVRFVFALPTS